MWLNFQKGGLESSVLHSPVSMHFLKIRLQMANYNVLVSPWFLDLLERVSRGLVWALHAVCLDFCVVLHVVQPVYVLKVWMKMNPEIQHWISGDYSEAGTSGGPECLISDCTQILTYDIDRNMQDRIKGAMGCSILHKPKNSWCWPQLYCDSNIALDV